MNIEKLRELQSMGFAAPDVTVQIVTGNVIRLVKGQFETMSCSYEDYNAYRYSETTFLADVRRHIELSYNWRYKYSFYYAQDCARLLEIIKSLKKENKVYKDMFKKKLKRGK